MKTRILESYHVTHTAKELAAELNTTPTKIRQIACELRKEGHHISNNMNPVGTVKYSKSNGHFRKKADNGRWQYVRKSELT